MAAAGIATGTRRSGHDLLGIYLNDHLAGATGGLELARRVAASHRGRAADGALQRLAADVAQDRAALADIMAALSIPVRAYKVYAARIGEKAARLKLNGYLFTRSPLSRLEELEMLRLGGLLVEAGNFSDLGEIGINPHRHLCSKSVRILGVGGEEPASYGPSMRQMARYMRHYPLRQFVSHRYPLRDVETAVHKAIAPDSMKVVIEPWA